MGGNIDAGWANDRMRGGSGGKVMMKSGEDGAGDNPTTPPDTPRDVTSDGQGGYNPSFYGSSWKPADYTMTPFSPFSGMTEQGASSFKPQAYTDGKEYGRWAPIGMPPSPWHPLFSPGTPPPSGGPPPAPGPVMPPPIGGPGPKPPAYRPPPPPGKVPGLPPPGWWDPTAPGPPPILDPGIGHVGPAPYPGPPGGGPPTAPPTAPPIAPPVVPPTPPGTGTSPRPKMGTSSYTPGLGTPPSIAQIQRAIGLGRGGDISASDINKYGVGGSSYDPTAVAVNSMGSGTLSGLQAKYANPQDWLKAQGYNANYIKSQPTSWADYGSK